MPLEIRKLVKAYGNQIVFNGFDISFGDNVINCILGSSGCGKTTLLNVISGLEEYESGSIEGVEDADFSYIFQEPRLLEWYTVEENIMFVLEGRGLDDASERVSRYLGSSGLLQFRNYYPAQLSGGMRQRLSIARAFAYPGRILLMDEPFKELDIKLKRELTDEFLRMWDEDRRTVLFVTHEPAEALMLSDNIHIIGGEPCIELKKITISAKREDRTEHLPEIVKAREILYSYFTD